MEGSQHNSEKEEGELSSDDDYQTKLSEMQTYIPFLQQMIQRLEESNDRSREAQLSKMKSLYGILNNTKKKLKVETLKRCEDVLRNLMNKVEKLKSPQNTGHKDVGKNKKKTNRDSYYEKSLGISDSSPSYAVEEQAAYSKLSSESEDSRNFDKLSDHEAVVSSTTQSCDAENSVTDVVKALKLAAARNNLRNKLENVKTNMHSTSHNDDVKGNVSSSSPSHLVSSTSPARKNYLEKNEYTREGLEQSRERLKKLMGRRLTASPSPPYHSHSDTHYRSFDRGTSDTVSPKTDWSYTKDNTWEQFSSVHSLSSDSCDGELFTRRDGRNLEKKKNITQSISYNTHHDERRSKGENISRNIEKTSALKCETHHKSSKKSLKSHVPSSSPTTKVFSPDRGDDSDKSDGGNRRVRAKLEQEIHKVHRVGISTGGALRSLVSKDDRNKSKGKSDDEKSPKKTSENERLSADDDRHNREKINKSDEKSLDPQRRQSVDRSPSPAKSKGCVDNIQSKKKSSAKIEKNDSIKECGDVKERTCAFTGMSQEELQRIVSENLRNLPSPPPITKEILENVKISPKVNTNPLWQSFPQSSNQPSTPASPDEVFNSVNYPQQEMYHGTSQQSFVTGRHGILDDTLSNVENYQMTENTLLHNTDNTVHTAYDSQLEERQGLHHHDYDQRPSFSNSQTLDNMRMSGIHCVTEDHRSVIHNHLVDGPRDRNTENTRYKVPLLEDPRSGHGHGMDDIRLNMSHSYRDDSRREHHRKIDDYRVNTERRRGLLPTPPRYEKYNYMGSSVNSRGIAQDLSSRFDQRSHMSDGRGNSLISQEQQNWDMSHWNTAASYQMQNIDRYPQHMYHAGRGQMNMTPDEQFSPTSHSQQYQWGSNDAQQQNMHSSYVVGYQNRMENHPQDHGQSKTRVQNADPRLHKVEHPDVSPDLRSGDPRLTHPDARHSAQYSGNRQPVPVTGVARIAPVSERDPRRRSIDEVDAARKPVQEQNEKKKRQSEPWRSRYTSNRSESLKKNVNDLEKRRTGTLEMTRNGEDSNKNASQKDTNAISSPLDCLYGAAAVPKTGKGYGFQNFRIPKIKRDSREVPGKPRPPTPPRPAPPKEKFDEISVKEISVEERDKFDSAQHSNDEKKGDDVGTSEPKEGDTQTKEVTQELVEALIRKSFESGEGKKLFEHARFFEKLSESLKAKKFRKIRRILESESGSEDSESDNTSKEPKKEEKGEKITSNEKHSSSMTSAVIVSDSDEPLAEKLEAKVRDTGTDVKHTSVNLCLENANSSSEILDIPKEIEMDSSKVLNKDGEKVDVGISKPVKKPAAKRRNALELLQQDVRDMFIREGVVTATGYRMCRLLKEVQSGASLEEISKNEARRMEDEADGESDASSIVSKNDKRSKGKCKTKKKPNSGSKTSRKLVKNISDPYSDSESSTVFGSNKKKTKRNRYTPEESDSDSSVNAMNCQTSRSKFSGIRGIDANRENIRRRRIPRVVLEKTDLSKFHTSSSKTNVDSEADNEDETLEESDSKKRNIAKRNTSKKGHGKKGWKKVSDDSLDEFFEREPYMFKRKKLKKSKPFLNKSINDSIKRLHKSGIPDVTLSELFISDGKSLPEKDPKSHVGNVQDIIIDDDEKKDSTSLIERLQGPFSELDDETERKSCNNTFDSKKRKGSQASDEKTSTGNSHHTDINVTSISDSRKEDILNSAYSSSFVSKSSFKLNLVKKKGVQRKKKCSKWQLGIIKKKSVHRVKTDLESVEGKVTDNDKLIELHNSFDDNFNISEYHEEDNDLQSDREQRCEDEYDNSSSEKSNQRRETSAEKGKGKTEKRERETQNFTDIDYAFHSETKQTACLLCSYEGKTIVQHYKQVHPESEVLIARLPLDEACRATTESEEKGYSENNFKYEFASNRKGSNTFFCRFCSYKVQYAINFYEHTSSHTGEYRYQCLKCPYMTASRTTFKGHFYNHHPKNKLKQGWNLKVLTEGPSNNAKYIFGYLCSKCNFVQLIHENIEKHIYLRHADDKEVKAIRINMSKPAPNESVEVLDDVESYIDTSEIVSDDEIGDADNFHEESSQSECKSEIRHISNATGLPDFIEKEESEFPNTENIVENKVKSEVHVKKPTMLEAFVPISMEVDDNENIILAERVKRMQDVIEQVNLNNMLARFQNTSEEGSDIIVLFEAKLQNIKQEIDEDKEVSVHEEGKEIKSVSISSDVEVMEEDSCTNTPDLSNNITILDKENAIDVSNNVTDERDILKLQSDNAVDNAIQNNDYNVTSEDTQSGPSLTSSVNSEKECNQTQSSESKSDTDFQDGSFERKTKLTQKTLDVASEASKVLPLTSKSTSNDEISERRITRSLSKTDEDGKSILSDDSGCETSNFEVIEITDESDGGEEEMDLECVITDAKSLQNDVDEGVSLIKGTLIERLTKHIVSKETMFEAYERKVSIVKEERKDQENCSVKPPPLAVSLNKQSANEKKSIAKPSAVVHVASLEARLCPDQSIVFSCLVPCCVFTTADALLMEKHLTRNHKPNWWDGVCIVCDKRVYGDNSLKGSPVEHKYPLSFALDHLRTVHLNNLSLCEELKDTSPVDINEGSIVAMNTNAWPSDSSQVLGDNVSLYENLGVSSSPSASEENDSNKIETPCRYIRTRRLSGDKLSGPPISQNQVVGSSNDTFMNLVSETGNNILTNEGGDDDLPFLKIESVVSLHPSVGSDINTFMDHSLSAPSISSPTAETLDPPSTSLEQSSQSSNLSQQPIVTTAQTLFAVPAKSPVKKQLQLVPLSPTGGMVPTSVSSSNIPQPLMNLAQLIRPGTRVLVPKENTSIATPSKTKTAVLWSGSSTLPNILPKPVTQTYIITSPGKSVSSTVVIPPNLVASSSLPTPSIVLPTISGTNSPVLTKLSVIPTLQSMKGPGSNISILQKKAKSSAIFISDSSARTAYFHYKRQDIPRPPLKNTRQKLVHKKCKTFEQTKASKLPLVYQNMLIHYKLRHLFKCMAKHCTFTSDSSSFFEEHCWKHVNFYQKFKQTITNGADKTVESADSSSGLPKEDHELEVRRKIELGFWPQCCYCCTLHDTPTALNIHIQEEHGHCLYQCAYCFFRAVTYSYIVLHQNTSHTDMRITVLMCHKIGNLLPATVVKPPRTEVVLPYICNQGSCGLAFWNPAAFWRHLENVHGNMTYYFCHMCVGQYVKPEKLLTHYKLHCHCFYQCQYCLHGSDTKEDMQHHLCNFHPNQKALVIMRDSDPNMPATGFEEEEKTIDMLDVIDLDEIVHEDSLIFPPTPSVEYKEGVVKFWKNNKSLVEEHPEINITDESLLVSAESAIICVLPGTSSSMLLTSENSVTPLCSENIDKPSNEEFSDKITQLISTDAGFADKTEKLNSTDDAFSDKPEQLIVSNIALSEKSDIGIADSSEDISSNVEKFDKASALSANTSSRKEENEDCDVIIIDESSDAERDCSSSESDIKEITVSQTKPLCNDEDADSDVMIIGSDEETVPSKRQKFDFNLHLQKSDPNYEPVVTLRHRDPESKARIESAVDPLAPDPTQNDNLALVEEGVCELLNTNESSNSYKTCQSTSNLESDFSQRNVIAHGVDKTVETPCIQVELSDTGLQNTTDTSCRDAQTKSTLCDSNIDNKEQQEQQQQQQQQEEEKNKQEQQNNLEKGRTDSNISGKDSAIDPEILAQSIISKEELEKTGASGEQLYRCGNVTCMYAAPTSNQLRDHLIICDLSRDSAGLTCVHCQRPFKQTTPYLEHLKHHGTCRYSCFICKFRAPLPQQVIKHVKQKHRIYNSIVLPVNQQNTDPETDLFVVCSKDKTRPKIVPHFRNKRIFNPEEVNFLPLKYISYHPLTCNVCNFRSKVVNNMRRHLNFHNDKLMNPTDIPLCDPVNPVPCLEKKEMMFDKMTNLAASSHPLGRMGGKPIASCASASGAGEQVTLPKFVAEHERYVCGSPGCNYLTCDETMLRYHMRALHCDETSYRCPHCPESMQKDLNGLPISIDRMGAHLKMHDSKLYKCTHCTYFHFQRHIVERHLADKHPEKRPFVHVVREEGEILTGKSEEILLREENTTSQPNPSVWMCGLCNERYATRAEVYDHTASVHNIRSQYKCALCTFKSSSKPNTETHFYSRHPGLELNFIVVCKRIEGNTSDIPQPASSNNVTSELPSKRFDTTPLWLRNMARIRHIRGVLLEDEEETRMHLQKIEEAFAPKKTKLKDVPTPSSSRAASPEPIEPDPLEQKFGPYGKPVMGNMFLCTLCNKYKTRFKADMKDHLYRELNYVKWMCKHCSLTTCNRHQIQKHSKVHEKEGKPERIIALEPEIDIEQWVDRLLAKQHRDMKGVPDVVASKSILSAISKSKMAQSSQSGGSAMSVLKTAATPSSNKQNSPLKVVELRDSEILEDDVSLVSERQISQKRKLASMAARDLEGFEDSPIKKCNLSTENQECRNKSEIEIQSTTHKLPMSKGSSPMKGNQTPTIGNTGPSTVNKYKCKDCKAVFSVVRGLKLHVRLVHLRLGSYSCGYCDRPAYSEMAIKHHCRSQHPNQPELINYNEGASNVKLDDEFWEKEYGIKPKSDDSASAKKYRKTPMQTTVQSATNVPAIISSVESSVLQPNTKSLSPKAAFSSDWVPSSSKSLPDSSDTACVANAVSSAESTSITAAIETKEPVSLQEENKIIEDTDDIILIDEIGKKCAHCEYRCKSTTDLRNHEMRHWVEKPFKCGHCEFEGVREYEVKKHSAKVHPNKKVRVIQKQLPNIPEIKPLQRTRKSLLQPGPLSDTVDVSGNSEDTTSDNVVKTLPEGNPETSQVLTESRKMFRCFYCPLRTTSLEMVHNHWEKTHKVRVISTTGLSKNGLPFRYKEVNMDDLLKGRETKRKKKTSMYTCSHCNKKGTLSIITLHHKQNHPEKPMKIVGIVTQYECAECQYVALASGTLKRHFESEHPGKEFRYMVCTTTQPAVFPDNKSALDREEQESTSNTSSTGCQPELKGCSSPMVLETSQSSKDKQVKYVCSWCSETCYSEVKMNFHHTMYHSHLEQKFSLESGLESATLSSSREKILQYACPKCSFKDSSLEQMGEHLRKHCRPFKCGYCSRLFELPIHVRNHISVMHSGQPPKIISVKEAESDLSALKEQILTVEEEVDSPLCTEIDLTERDASNEESLEPMKKKKAIGFARKSTSMKHEARRILHIARKSTNPTPYIYPANIDEISISESGSSRSDSPAILEEYSFYGQKPVPLDWKKIRTTVNYGGVYVQVNVASMSQIFNLSPIVVVKDIKTEWKPV